MNETHACSPRSTARRRPSVATWLAAGVLAGAAAVSSPAPAAAGTAERPPAEALAADFRLRHGAAPAWADERRFESLLAALEALRTHGLDPAHYHRDRLARMRGDAAAREHLATRAWLAAGRDLLAGRTDPRLTEPHWTLRARTADLPARLEAALADGDVAGGLLALAPAHVEYRLMQAALARLLSGAAPLAERLPASVDPRYDIGRARLIGDRDASIGPPAASRPPPAPPAPSIDDRIDRLRVNLERWRWMPADLGERHVRVNIAAYRVTRREHGRALQRHRAIVGSGAHRTPVFSDRIRHIVFNPWWETPAGLAVREQLPVFRRFPHAARQLGFEVLDEAGRTIDPDTIDWHAVPAQAFPYRLRQAPGPLNALGRVKIMFPNVHDVYLHDTPGPELFLEPTRALSAGCVRTDDIAALAAWLLERTPGWDATRVRAALDGPRTLHVALDEPVPVHILYFTAEPDPEKIDGTIRYLDDVYDRDARLLHALDGPAG